MVLSLQINVLVVLFINTFSGHCSIYIPPEKIRKLKVFPIFSEGIGMEHLPEMGQYEAAALVFR